MGNCQRSGPVFCFNCKRDCSQKRRTQRDQRRHRGRADHPVEHREHHGFLVGEADHHREGGVLTGGGSGGDAGVVVQLAGDGRDHEKGEDLPLLAGIPLALKDNMNLVGSKTTASSKILENFVSPFNATITQKLLDNLVPIVGKANLDEFAMGSSNENSAFKKVHNPWDLNKVPGGSSGGSAASVASCEATLALGSDTGGSIRLPASFCGIVGMKPTYGRVSRYGLIAFASSLDQIGPFARSVEDAANLLEVISGHDPKDSTSLDMPVEHYADSLKNDIKGKKVGVIKELMSEGLADDVAKAIQNAIDTYKKLGCEIVEISLPKLKYSIGIYYILATAECSSNLARFDGVKYGYRTPDAKNLLEMYTKTRAEGFGPEVKRRIMLGTYALSSGYYDAYYKKAQQMRALVTEDFKEAFRKYDRQRLSLLASNIAVAGSLNAFTQNLTLVRAIERNDFKVLDKDAYTNLKMVIDDASVTGES